MKQINAFIAGRIVAGVMFLLSFAPSAMAQQLLSFKDVNGKYGYKDTNGKVVIQPAYINAVNFKNGFGMVGVPDPDVEFGTLWSLIDKNGNAITQQYAVLQEYGSIYRVKANNKFGLIAWNGKKLVDPIYEYINENNYKGFTEGVVVAKLNGKWGMIDTLGKVLVPFIYTRLDDYNDGLCPAQVNNLFGYINKKGEMAIEAKYKSVFPFSNGFAWVSLPEGCAIIDTKGKAICPFKYQFNSAKMTATFYDGMAPVYSKEKKLGFINTNGVEVIPCIYDYEALGNYDFFIDGKAKVKKDGRVFYIDKTGLEITANAPGNNSKSPSATKDNIAFYNKMAGIWIITAKDKQFGLPITNKMELKITNGKPEAWLLNKNGSPQYQYKDFSLFRDNHNIVFTFEIVLSPNSPASRGSGTVSNDFTRMTGSALTPSPLNHDKIISEEWVAVKEFAGSMPSSPATKPSPPSSNNIESIRRYATIPSPEPAESNFRSEIANAGTTSETRGSVLNKYIGAIMATSYTDDQKSGLIADKYASVLPIDFHAVHWSMMKSDSKTVGLIVSKVFKIMPADQVKALKDMSQYTIAKYQAKYNKAPVPTWPANVPLPGQGWKK